MADYHTLDKCKESLMLTGSFYWMPSGLCSCCRLSWVFTIQGFT